MKVLEKCCIRPPHQAGQFTRFSMHLQRNLFGGEVLVMTENEDFPQVRRHFIQGMHDMPKQGISTPM